MDLHNFEAQNMASSTPKSTANARNSHTKGSNFDTPGNKLTDVVPITPMPKFNDMDTPEIQRRAQKYGLKKTMGKKKLKTKLQEVYMYTHQIYSPDLAAEPGNLVQKTQGPACEKPLDSKILHETPVKIPEVSNRQNKPKQIEGRHINRRGAGNSALRENVKNFFTSCLLEASENILNDVLVIESPEQNFPTGKSGRNKKCALKNFDENTKDDNGSNGEKFQLITIGETTTPKSTRCFTNFPTVNNSRKNKCSPENSNMHTEGNHDNGEHKLKFSPIDDTSTPKSAHHSSRNRSTKGSRGWMLSPSPPNSPNAGAYDNDSFRINNFSDFDFSGVITMDNQTCTSPKSQNLQTVDGCNIDKRGFESSNLSKDNTKDSDGTGTENCDPNSGCPYDPDVSCIAGNSEDLSLRSQNNQNLRAAYVCNFEKSGFEPSSLSKDFDKDSECKDTDNCDPYACPCKYDFDVSGTPGNCEDYKSNTDVQTVSKKKGTSTGDVCMAGNSVDTSCHFKGEFVRKSNSHTSTSPSPLTSKRSGVELSKIFQKVAECRTIENCDLSNLCPYGFNISNTADHSEHETTTDVHARNCNLNDEKDFDMPHSGSTNMQEACIKESVAGCINSCDGAALLSRSEIHPDVSLVLAEGPPVLSTEADICHARNKFLDVEQLYVETGHSISDMFADLPPITPQINLQTSNKIVILSPVKMNAPSVLIGSNSGPTSPPRSKSSVGNVILSPVKLNASTISVGSNSTLPSHLQSSVGNVILSPAQINASAVPSQSSPTLTNSNVISLLDDTDDSVNDPEVNIGDKLEGINQKVSDVISLLDDTDDSMNNVEVLEGNSETRDTEDSQEEVGSDHEELHRTLFASLHVENTSSTDTSSDEECQSLMQRLLQKRKGGKSTQDRAIEGDKFDDKHTSYQLAAPVKSFLKISRFHDDVGQNSDSDFDFRSPKYKKARKINPSARAGLEKCQNTERNYPSFAPKDLTQNHDFCESNLVQSTNLESIANKRQRKVDFFNSQASKPSQTSQKSPSKTTKQSKSKKPKLTKEELHIEMCKAIRSDRELYIEVLLYKPIYLSRFRILMQDCGLKVKASDLVDFLDDKGITFSTADENKNKGPRVRQRRNKNTAKK